MTETVSDSIGSEATFDREATVAAYARLPHGSTDTCECLYCANYKAQRRREMFSPSLLAICDKVGIDVLKEGETTFYSRTKSGLCVYGGEMHFVGSVKVDDLSPDNVTLVDFRGDVGVFADFGPGTAGGFWRDRGDGHILSQFAMGYS